MSNFRYRSLSILFSLASTACLPAQASTFCVNSASGIQAALTASASNNQTNFIKVVAGNYALTSALGYSSSTTNSLFLGGGYAPGCASKVAAPTVLNGQGNVRPLFIYALNANINVEGFDFVGGLSTDNRGGGLSISGVDVRVDLNRFIGNHADDYAGGLSASSTGELRVRNNLFIVNSAASIGAAELTCSGAAYVTSNTVVANISDASTTSGGFYVGGSAHFSISNNILWNNNANGAVDFNANTGHERLNNDIGSSSGIAPDASSSGNLSVNPDFAPCAGFLCFSFELKRSSPMVDNGKNAPPAGLTSSDLLEAPRIVGGLVDIGAYELDKLFADGFE